jgi:hypothetical protein
VRRSHSPNIVCSKTRTHNGTAHRSHRIPPSHHTTPRCTARRSQVTRHRPSHGALVVPSLVFPVCPVAVPRAPARVPSATCAAEVSSIATVSSVAARLLQRVPVCCAVLALRLVSHARSLSPTLHTLQPRSHVRPDQGVAPLAPQDQRQPAPLRRCVGARSIGPPGARHGPRSRDR